MNQEITRDRLAIAVRRFQQELILSLGTKGYEPVWEKIEQALPTDVNGRVLMDVLRNPEEVESYVKFSFPHNSEVVRHNAVPIIKALRSYCKIGLKEAKDLYDYGRNGSTVVAKTNNLRDSAALEALLTQYGATIEE